jgi:hypothetical protein
VEENIQREGVHNVFTKSFSAKTFSRVSVWINHELTPTQAKALHELVEQAAIDVVKAWVRP